MSLFVDGESDDYDDEGFATPDYGSVATAATATETAPPLSQSQHKSRKEKGSEPSPVSTINEPTAEDLLNECVNIEMEKRMDLREKHGLNTVWQDLQGLYDTPESLRALEQFNKFDNAHGGSSDSAMKSSSFYNNISNITNDQSEKRSKKTRRLWTKHATAQTRAVIKRTQNAEKVTLNLNGF